MTDWKGGAYGGYDSAYRKELSGILSGVVPVRVGRREVGGGRGGRGAGGVRRDVGEVRGGEAAGGGGREEVFGGERAQRRAALAEGQAGAGGRGGRGGAVRRGGGARGARGTGGPPVGLGRRFARAAAGGVAGREAGRAVV